MIEIKDKNGNRRAYCAKGEVKIEMKRLCKEKPEFSPFTAYDKDKEIAQSETIRPPKPEAESNDDS